MKKFIIMAIVSLLFAFFSAYAILISSRNSVAENVQRQYVELERREVRIVKIGGCAYIFWGRDMEHFQGCPAHAHAHAQPTGDEPELKLNY